MKVGILLTCGKDLHDLIVALIVSLTPPFFYWMAWTKLGKWMLLNITDIDFNSVSMIIAIGIWNCSDIVEYFPFKYGKKQLQNHKWRNMIFNWFFIKFIHYQTVTIACKQITMSPSYIIRVKSYYPLTTCINDHFSLIMHGISIMHAYMYLVCCCHIKCVNTL